VILLPQSILDVTSFMADFVQIGFCDVAIAYLRCCNMFFMLHEVIQYVSLDNFDMTHGLILRCGLNVKQKAMLW